MITLGAWIQHTEEIPKEVAEWLAERNAKYPGINFIVDRDEVREVDQPREERGMRNVRERYAKCFAPFEQSADAEHFSVLNVGFLYGQETWFIKITSVVNEKGEIKNTQTVEEGERVEPFSPQLRNEIAGFDPKANEWLGDLQERLNPEGGGRPMYAERRSEAMPFRERPEAFTKVEWDSRHIGLTMTGKEFKDALNDPKKRAALEQSIRDAREGKKPS